MQAQSLAHLFRDALRALSLDGRMDSKNRFDYLRGIAIAVALIALDVAFDGIASFIMGNFATLASGSIWLTVLAILLSVILSAALLLMSMLLVADFFLATGSITIPGMLAISFLPMSLWASAGLRRIAEPPRAFS
jgi:hypothetical protein